MMPTSSRPSRRAVFRAHPQTLLAQVYSSGTEHCLGGGSVDAEFLNELIERYTVGKPVEQLLHG